MSCLSAVVRKFEVTNRPARSRLSTPIGVPAVKWRLFSRDELRASSTLAQRFGHRRFAAPPGGEMAISVAARSSTSFHSIRTMETRSSMLPDRDIDDISCAAFQADIREPRHSRSGVVSSVSAGAPASADAGNAQRRTFSLLARRMTQSSMIFADVAAFLGRVMAFLAS